jgi:hypothetical protein
MQTHDISLAKKIGHLDEPVGEAVERRLAPARDQNLHAESVGDAAGRPPGGPETDDAHLQPGQLDQRKIREGEIGATRPGPGMHGLGVVADVMGDFQQQRKDRLRDGGRAVAGDDADRDALLFRRLDVDDVVAAGGDADVLQLRTGRHDLGGDRDLVGQQAVGAGVRNARRDLVLGRSIMVGDLRDLSESVPGKVSGIERVAVENDEVHGLYLTK